MRFQKKVDFTNENQNSRKQDLNFVNLITLHQVIIIKKFKSLLCMIIGFISESLEIILKLLNHDISNVE